MGGLKPPESPFIKPRPIPIVRDDVPGLEIARGRVAGMVCIDKFGANQAVGTSLETLWDGGGLYNWPTTTQQYNISSSSVDDSVSASGAQVMTLFGLDTDYLDANEDITLNGQTTVITVNSYSRIFRGIITRADGDYTNLGDIYAYTGANVGGIPAVTANIAMKISLGLGQTLMSTYTIPANKVGYMIEYFATSGAGKNANVQIRERMVGGAWNVKQYFDILNNTFSRHHKIPHKLEPKTDIEIRAKIDQAPATQVSGGFDIVLIEKKGEIGF